MGKLLEVSWIILIILGSSEFSCSAKWYEEKYYHKPTELDAATYTILSHSGNVDFEQILDPMLIPRVPGSDNHVAVGQYIIDFMNRLGWSIETDEFVEQTPFGIKPFKNIITTLNPDTPRRLVLACHYDSKYSRENTFIGATDSAVPCSQMLHLAATMKSMLDQHKNSPHNVTLQFIFFDGEEAFVSWSSTDSLYGSRHLAAKWERTPYPPNNVDRTNMLHRMDMLVLLDLLGTKDVKLYSYYDETNKWHNILLQTEQQLKRSKLWGGSSRSAIFQARRYFGGVEDDHIPFVQRDVHILHLISSPFPSVWHTDGDNKEALDFSTIDNLNKIFRLFIARYLWGKQESEKTETSPIMTPTTPSTSTANSFRPINFPCFFFC